MGRRSKKSARASSRCAARWDCWRRPASRSIQSREQPRQELHAGESRASAEAVGGERGTLSGTTRHRRPAGSVGSRYSEEDALQRETREVAIRNGEAGGYRDAGSGLACTRRETVEHPFGTLKMRMGATHFLCKTLPKVATEMALCVLGYNMTRVLNIVGVKPLLGRGTVGHTANADQVIAA